MAASRLAAARMIVVNQVAAVWMIAVILVAMTHVLKRVAACLLVFVLALMPARHVVATPATNMK